MSTALTSPGGGGSIDAAEIAAIQAQVDQLAQQQGNETLDSDPDIEWAGAMLQGSPLPPASARLEQVGNGKKRYVARSVSKDDTKIAAWAAQGNPVPAYALPVITSTGSPPSGVNGTAGYTFNHTWTSDLGGGDTTASIDSGGTDATHIAGLVLTNNGNRTATLAGTPNATGTFIYVLKVGDELGGTATQICTLVIAPANTATFGPLNAPPQQPTVGVPFSWDVSGYAVGFTGAKTFASSSLPNHHLTINAAGTVSGTPLAADYGKSFNVTITCTTVADGTKSASITLTIPPQGSMTITTNSLPAMTQNQAATTFQLVKTGGVDPTTWAVTAGALPAGVTLDASGLLHLAPTVSGPYDFTVTATDSTPGTALTDDQEYTGTIAVAAAPFAWFGGASSYDLTADAGNPKVGDLIDIDLARYESGTPAGAVTIDSGAPPTTPAFGLDVIGGHYKGTCNAQGTTNPLLRANDTGGVKAVQCHLTIISATPGVDIISGLVLGDGISKANGKANLAKIVSAIAAAKSQGYRLKSSAGTDTNPVLVGLSRDTFSSAAYLSSGSTSIAGVAWWDLGNVLFYFVAGQPTNSLECMFMQVWNVTNGVFNVKFDARGSDQPAPPAKDSGAPGFYNNGIHLMRCVNPTGHLEVYNGVGVTGNSKNGTNETFDVAIRQHGGGGELEIVNKGQWGGDTGTDYSSGIVMHQTPETDAQWAARLKLHLTVDKRRHVFGEYAGGPVQIMGGSTGSNCSRGIWAEDGAPNAGCIRSPSLWVGEAGQPSNPVVTTNCGNGGVGTTSSGGGLVGEVKVFAHQSNNDAHGYLTAGTTNPFTIAHSTVNNPDGSIIFGQAAGGKSAEQNLQKVTVDGPAGTCEVNGLGAKAQVTGGTTGTVGSGSWKKNS